MFIDERLDTCVAYGFMGGPQYSTTVVRMNNGHEQRNGQWLFPIHRYSAQYMNIDEDLRDEILAAFHVCRGQLHCIRFKDHNDFEGIAQPFLLINGIWRMAKQYTKGAHTTSRLVQAPVQGTITLGGGGSLANLDYSTGIYNGDATGLTWSGEFDVWVRFESDYNAFVIGNRDAHTADISLLEVLR